jgi:hypothetical protein
MAKINNRAMPIIKNMGYMWHRKYVNWEGGRKLFGSPEVGKGKDVNFADQAGIYVLYDRNLQPIYVGQTGSGKTIGLFDRLRDHTHDELFCMWERFSWFGFYSVNTVEGGVDKGFDDEFEIETDVNELMNIIETLIIRTCRPSFNKASGCLVSGTVVEDVQWYYQEAEWEEQEAEFKRLQGTCKSLGKEKS